MKSWLGMIAALEVESKSAADRAQHTALQLKTASAVAGGDSPVVFSMTLPND